ncbi:methyltransferase domain-containing protein [Kiloniella laminariae]|uniref:Methyltransferase domain-containing protein n=1 Tax=Kiloniella laminariae TaxID=454162 RepID=A0ABT4LFF8_9PROT|nr:class I SAM-dependent methyltransferase [Kiloniella laminariae]MCZ4279839.1 methyltransferase domain-containing protein [Kiloniella laminariae]
MTDSDKIFTGSIPEFYDSYLVPLIFEDYARDLAERVVGLRPSAVLETAAGSGVVPRALAPQLDASVRYVVSDLNQPMLDHAAKKQGSHDCRVEWQQADALELPFADASFDVVLCQFGVMFYPDRVRGYAEARRVLKPGGCFVFSVWDHIRENVFADLVTAAAATVFPEDPPLFMARTPHGYHERATIERDLKQAGFSQIAIETRPGVSRAPNPRHPAIAFCQGTPLRNEIEVRDSSLLEQVTNTAASHIAERYGNGSVEARMQAHVITAMR